MAYAAERFVQVTEQRRDGVMLELSEKETRVLRYILGCAGGRGDGAREAYAIGEALEDAGYEFILDEFAVDTRDGVIFTGRPGD